jgi:lipopolysaccharide export LptBFGC system permease protein LptF
MPRRAPWTVWAYIASEMWRLILLTTGVLLCVTAFGVSVKYLADGKLGASDCLRIMFLFMPPMLHYVLPFAACFGATLAYHRLAADNEAVACHAGGISHRGLLGPAIITGVVLSAALVMLSGYVIPRFLEKAALVVSEDATRLIVASIQRKEAVRLNDTWVYADEVVEHGPDEKSGAFQRLWLGNVMVVNMAEDGGVRDQAAAREAYVWLKRIAGSTETEGGGPMTQVIIRPKDYFISGQRSRSAAASTVLTFEVPNTFSDDPKFLTTAQLRELHDRPEAISAVEKRRKELALALAQREAFEVIRAQLQQKGFVELVDGLGERFTLRGSDLRLRPRVRALEAGEDETQGWYSVEPVRRGEDVVVDIVQGNGAVRRRQAKSIWLQLTRSETGQDLSITLEYNDVSAEDIEAGNTAKEEAPTGAVLQSVESGLNLVGGSGVEVMGESSLNLMRAAESRLASRPGDAAVVGPRLNDLRNRIDDLRREILSKRHERLAMSMGCLVMVVLGAVMALRLRESLPLTIYLWAFFPALGAVLTVSAGQQLTHEHGIPGLLLMWGGIVGLAGYTMLEFTRLSRH